MISRDWMCLNGACRATFHSFEHRNPECPYCGCVKVSWLPGGGHIAKKSPGVDKTMRELATSYGMSNINSPSPSRLNRAMPKYVQPPVDPSLGVWNFGPGFSSMVSPHGAVCLPSVSQSGEKVSVPINREMERSQTFMSPQQSTRIVGRYQG